MAVVTIIDDNRTLRTAEEITAGLSEHGIDYELRKLPAYGTWQLFFHDPNGAKVEIDFDPAESAPA